MLSTPGGAIVALPVQLMMVVLRTAPYAPALDEPIDTHIITPSDINAPNDAP